MLTNARTELPGLQKSDHKTVLERWTQLLISASTTVDDFNVVGFAYQAIPQTRVGLKFTIYSFHPQLAPSPQTCIIIWLVIISPSRTAIHAFSFFVPKSPPQELLHLTLTPASLPFIKVQDLPDIAYANSTNLNTIFHRVHSGPIL